MNADDLDRLRAALDGARVTLARAGQDALARYLDPAIPRAGAACPLIVVAGEAGRGKSAFVNALLGWIELSPTGPSGATACRIQFTHCAQPAADIYAAGRCVRVEPRELGAYTNHLSAGDVRVAQRPEAAIVGVPHPLLTLVALVDTPGFGVGTAEAELALAVLDQGDAMVFVGDALTPVTASEIAFLERVAHRVERVLVVVAKIDRCPHWRTVVEETRANLEQREALAGRVDVVAVSSRLALTAATAEVRLRSGYTQVDEFIESYVVRRAAAIRTINAARRALTALTTLHRRADLEGCDTEVAATQALEEREAAVAAFTARTAGWLDDVKAQFKPVSARQRGDLRRGTAALTVTYQDRLVNTEVGSPAEFAQALHADVVALAVDVADRTRGDVRNVVDELSQRLGLPWADDALTEAGAEPSDNEGDADWKVALAPEKRRRRSADRYADFNSFRSGMAAVSLLGTVRLAAAPVAIAAGLGSPLLLAVLALGTGIAAVKWSRRASTSSVQQNELRAWIPQQTARANADLAVAADQELERRYDVAVGLLRARIDAVRGQLAVDVEIARNRVDEIRRRESASRAPLLALRDEIRSAHTRLDTALDRFQRNPDATDLAASIPHQAITQNRS